jgi:DNA-binding MarR family transcriptional regulator
MAQPEAALSIREQAHRAGRELSARSVMFYTLVARLVGLSVSDLRAWDLLVSYGPMSATDFADLTGLTAGAVTGLIDRLAKAGAVKRVADPSDRRKIIIVVTSELRSGRTSVYFDAFQAALKRLYKRYSDEEIRIIDRFSREVSALLQEETARLRSTNSEKREVRSKPRQAGASAKTTKGRKSNDQQQQFRRQHRL